MTNPSHWTVFYFERDHGRGSVKKFIDHLNHGKSQQDLCRIFNIKKSKCSYLVKTMAKTIFVPSEEVQLYFKFQREDALLIAEQAENIIAMPERLKAVNED